MTRRRARQREQSAGGRFVERVRGHPFYILVLLLMIGAVFVLFASEGLRGHLVAHVTRSVIATDELAPADVIFIFNGKVNVRAGKAAALYRSGYAERILLTSTADALPAGDGARLPSSSERMIMALVDSGVPRTAIRTISCPGGAANTRDEARALRAFLETNGRVRSIIAVTTDYHSARAREVLRQELRGTGAEILMAPAPNDGMLPGNWWRLRRGRQTYLLEYLKLLYARIRP